MKKIIKLTEQDLMKIVKKVISEVAPTQPVTGSTSTAQQGTEYGELVGDDVVNKVKSNVTGSASQVNMSGSKSKNTVVLYKDQAESQAVNNQGYPVKGIRKKSDGKIEVNLGSFTVTTDCTKISKNDNGFDYSGGQYYSKALLEQTKSQC